MKSKLVYIPIADYPKFDRVMRSVTGAAYCGHPVVFPALDRVRVQYVVEDEEAFQEALKAPPVAVRRHPWWNIFKR